MLPLASSTWDHLEQKVVSDVVSSGNLTMGEKVRDFENKFSAYIGKRFSVMFNSGSSANLAMLAAMRYTRHLDVPHSGEVIVPAVSWSTTFYPVHQLGYRLNFVDIDPYTLNLDVNQVRESINSSTVAILAVNLLGNPAHLQELKSLADQHGLLLLEDNCESLGAETGGSKAGSFGLMSTHSFYFSHHICTMEGGMVSTDSADVRDVLISLRSHGWLRGLSADNSIHPLSQDAWSDLFKFVLPGYNLRPLEISGAIGSIQLDKFDRFLDSRRQNATTLMKLVGSKSNFRLQSETGRSSWFGFAFILQNNLQGRRKEVVDRLREQGVESRPIVAGNFAKNPVMRHLNHSPIGDLPVADTVDREGFFIGNHHYDICSSLERVVEIIDQIQ